MLQLNCVGTEKTAAVLMIPSNLVRYTGGNVNIVNLHRAVAKVNKKGPALNSEPGLVFS